MADNIASFFEESLNSIDISKCSQIVYSSGPSSFTSARITNAFLKGIAISLPEISFIGMSNFLTYLKIALEHSPDGSLAIPTMRGDFFVVDYRGEVLGETKMISEVTDKYIIDNNEIFDNINLSNIQKDLLESVIASSNPSYITNSLSIDYGFTPEYRTSKA